MTKDDVRRIFNVTRFPSICVSVRLVPEIPGYVQSVYVRPPSKLCVDYEVYGLDEGGDYFEGVYETLDAAIDAAVDFCEKPLAEWEDLEEAGFYPDRDLAAKLADGHKAMERLRKSGGGLLPCGAKFVRKG